MLSTSSATEVAFIVIALIQGVFAIIWACGAWWVRAPRLALAHWAVWAGLSAITWMVLAAQFKEPPLVGVLIGVLAIVVLQRGIRLFIGRESKPTVYVVLFVIVITASQLSPALRYLEAATNFGVLASLYFYIAADLYVHARDQLRFRRPILLSIPLLIGGVAFSSRALRALFSPDSVLTEMATNSALNLNSALLYISLVLMLHATLTTLVVGRLIAELQQLSHRDALTGLLNRRAMEETLYAQIRSSRRSGEHFVVMMLDLDYFKRVNDSYGHAVGDLALKHASNLLQSVLRDVDHLARFGGEEFVMLMPNATLAQAEPIAERLRSLLAATPLSHSGQSVALSVSIGIAEWRDKEEDSSLLLQRADAALFQAKVQGRNRVVVEKAERGLEAVAATT